MRGSKLGYRIRRQQPLGPFVVDFYCTEARLAIEIDGDGHNEYFDEHRDAQMVSVEVMRFRNSEVNDNVFDVLTKIEAALHERAGMRGPSAPSPRTARRERGGGQGVGRTPPSRPGTTRVLTPGSLRDRSTHAHRKR